MNLAIRDAGSWPRRQAGLGPSERGDYPAMLQEPPVASSVAR